MLQSIIHDLLNKASKEKPIRGKLIVDVAKSKGLYQFTTSDVRAEVRKMRLDGAWICALDGGDGGYYYAKDKAELEEYLERLHRRYMAVRKVWLSLTTSKFQQCTAKI